MVDRGVLEAARGECLRHALEMFEHGHLDASEYRSRVDDLQAATSVAELATILARPGSAGMPGPSPVPVPGAVTPPPSLPSRSSPEPSAPTGPPTAGGGRAVPGAGLDPVDLALMGAAPRRSGPTTARSRYLALVMVLVLFAVLVVVGMVLASHVHPSTGTGSGVRAPIGLTVMERAGGTG